MGTDELKKYIQESLAAGKTIEIIKQSLLEAGWHEVDVSKVFEEMGMMKKSRNYLSFLGIFSLIAVSWIAVLNFFFTKASLFEKYLQSEQYLFSPSPSIDYSASTIAILLAVVICSFIIALIVMRNTRKVGIIVGGLLSLGSIPVGMAFLASDHMETFVGIFLPALTAFSVFVVLPSVLILPLFFLFFNKLHWHEYWIIIIFPLIVLVYGVYMNTCGFGTSSKCQLRYELKKLDPVTCETPGLRPFEKNACYEVIAIQTKNRDLCTKMIDDSNSFGMVSCIKGTPYNDEANTKIFNYGKEALVFCRDSSPGSCEPAVQAIYKQCFNDHIFSHIVDCIKIQQTQVNYMSSQSNYDNQWGYTWIGKRAWFMPQQGGILSLLEKQ